MGSSGNTSVYFFGECMKDLSRSDCDHCFAQIKIRILSCLAFQTLVRGGRIFYDGCYVRYVSARMMLVFPLCLVTTKSHIILIAEKYSLIINFSNFFELSFVKQPLQSFQR